MPVSSNYVAIKGSVHPHPKDHRKVGPTASSDQLTVTLLLRRKTGAAKEAQIVAADAPRPTQEESANSRGADQGELDQVIAFAKGAGLEVVESDATRRSVVVRGSVADVDEAFAVQLNDYQYEYGKYRSHDGAVSVPSNIADYVEAVVGLTVRFARDTSRRRGSAIRPIRRTQASDSPAGGDPRRRGRSNDRPLRDGDAGRSSRLRRDRHRCDDGGARRIADAEDRRRAAIGRARSSRLLAGDAHRLRQRKLPGARRRTASVAASSLMSRGMVCPSECTLTHQ